MISVTIQKLNRHTNKKTMKHLSSLLIIITFFHLSCFAKTGSDKDSIRIKYHEVDRQEAMFISRTIDTCRKNIIDFFENDFAQDFQVIVHSHRDSLDKQWQTDWNMPDFKSACWMVASGLSTQLDILSPRVWKEQACEHNPDDTIALTNLILHEMVHVYHAQLNPSNDFINIENIDWFIEGLAVYASGQLDTERISRVIDFLNSENSTQHLNEIWSGENRYGLAGSMIAYIDFKYGRKVLIDLLQETKAKDILSILEISEKDLITQWKQYVLK